MIKILNRRESGNLFHYAHFICDCLFPEIIAGIYKNKRIIREESISQTLGNFLPIYCMIMNCKCIEIELSLFDSANAKLYINKAKEELTSPIYFEIFRKYMFNRFKINPDIIYPKYPSVILIQRGKRVKLIRDESLELNNGNYTNGAERREINNIEKVKIFMKNKYGNNFQTLILENIPFEEQIQYFNNAKIIVCAHGACMSNLFFCKKDTILFEITCGEVWTFFDTITKNLQIIHHKIKNNNSDIIINRIRNENIVLSNEIPFTKNVIEEEINKKEITKPVLNKKIKRISINKVNNPKPISNKFLYTTGISLF
jgi:hypothetical protein